MNRIKSSLCLLLILGILLSLCACGKSANTPTAPTAEATEPTTEATDPTTDPTQASTEPVENENPVGIYRCVSLRLADETDYQESPGGYGIDIYENGMAMIYVADCVFDLSWNVEGKQFTATTIDGSNLLMEGTIDGDILEVTFDGMGLRFRKKSQQELADEAVGYLRCMMEDTAQQFAVAYLGWKEPNEDLHSVIIQRCPLLLGSEPFISLIPEERVFGDSGEIYCIVPNDSNMQVTIKRLQDAPNVEDMVKEVVYEGNLGDPFILLANEGDFYQDTQVIFTDSEGNQTLWYPMTNQYYTAYIPENDDGEPIGYDFSYYSEIYPYGFNLWMNDGWDWVESSYLTTTCWNRYFEVIRGDEYVAYNWSMNLSEDGTCQIDLISADDATVFATYNGTWEVTELDIYSGLSLNLTCSENVAPMDLPDLITEEYVILRAPEEDNLVIGIREGQQLSPIFTDEESYCSVWYGAVG